MWYDFKVEGYPQGGLHSYEFTADADWKYWINRRTVSSVLEIQRGKEHGL